MRIVDVQNHLVASLCLISLCVVSAGCDKMAGKAMLGTSKLPRFIIPQAPSEMTAIPKRTPPTGMKG